MIPPLFRLVLTALLRLLTPRPVPPGPDKLEGGVNPLYLRVVQNAARSGVVPRPVLVLPIIFAPTSDRLEKALQNLPGRDKYRWN